MNIRDLTYLVALADLGHFGKAAQSCFVSQPALSMQIKKLETYLGVKLLERTNKSVLLTECGSIIAERARSILNEVDELREIAKSAQDPYSGELNVGIFPTLAPFLLPLIIPALSKAYPRVSFYLTEDHTASLIDKLKQGKLHAAFLASPIVETGLDSSLLFEEEFLLATPNRHHLAQKKTIRQQDLEGKDLLLLEEGHCMRDQALALCQRMNAGETQSFRGTSLETLRQMVAAGVGITLMPRLACEESRHLSYVPFSSPKPVRAIGLYWRASSAKCILLREMAGQIKNMMMKQKSVKVFLK